MAIRVLAIDPGRTTGYCLAILEPKVSLTYMPCQFLHDVDEFWKLITDFKPEQIIIEDFEFRQGKQRTGLVLFSVQLIGVARLYSLIAPPPVGISIQKAATGKSYFSDALLKRNGLWKPGNNWNHSMDASRHLLHWVTFGAGYEHNSAKHDGTFIKMVDINEWLELDK